MCQVWLKLSSSFKVNAVDIKLPSYSAVKKIKMATINEHGQVKQSVSQKLIINPFKFEPTRVDCISNIYYIINHYMLTLLYSTWEMFLKPIKSIIINVFIVIQSYKYMSNIIGHHVTIGNCNYSPFIFLAKCFKFHRNVEFNKGIRFL